MFQNFKFQISIENETFYQIMNVGVTAMDIGVTHVRIDNAKGAGSIKTRKDKIGILGSSEKYRVT